MTSITGPVSASYAYDGEGLRLNKTVAGVSTDFTYSGDGGMAMLLQCKTGGVTTDYIYGADGQVVEQYTSTARSFLHHDQIGSVRVVTDNAGAKAGTVSDGSFGGVLAQTGAPVRRVSRDRIKTS